MIGVSILLKQLTYNSLYLLLLRGELNEKEKEMIGILGLNPEEEGETIRLYLQQSLETAELDDPASLICLILLLEGRQNEDKASLYGELLDDYYRLKMGLTAAVWRPHYPGGAEPSREILFLINLVLMDHFWDFPVELPILPDDYIDPKAKFLQQF